MGEDVIAVGTVCNGDKQLIEEGKQFGTTLQSPLHEGQLAIKMVEEYLDHRQAGRTISTSRRTRPSPQPDIGYRQRCAAMTASSTASTSSARALGAVKPAEQNDDDFTHGEARLTGALSSI